MATWQDGPEYAPLERPDQFAVPEVAPLEVAAAPAAAPPAPVERPAFDGPSSPVAPLEALVPLPADRRDPERPFEVAASNLTTPGAWAGVHGSAPHEVAPAPGTVAPWPVQGWTYDDPGGPPGAAPRAPGVPAAQALPPAPGFPSAPAQPGAVGYPGPQGQNGFPVPGTPEWFGPGAYGEPPPSPNAVDARQVLYAVTPALLICLGLGVIFSPLSPVLVVLAFVLSRRVRVAQVQVRRTFAVALGTLGAFAVIGLANLPLGVDEWWAVLSSWGRLVCVITAVVVTMQVWSRLKSRSVRPEPPQPPLDRGPWS